MKKLSLLSLILSILIFTNCGSDDGGGIQIDPLSLDFSDSELTVDESAGTQIITVALGETAAISGTFTITLGGTATYGDDYTTSPEAVDGVITISVAEGDESKEITVSIVDDTELELDETIELAIATDIEELELGTNTTATITLTSNDQAFVAIDRASGQLYMVDLTDGTQTDLLAITGVMSSEIFARTDQGENANIRSFAFDATSGTGFVGQNSNGGSKIYSVNMTTGAATEIFSNDEEDFMLYGVTDLHMDGETLYGAGYYEYFGESQRIEQTESGFSYFNVNMSTGAITNPLVFESADEVGGAFVLDSEDDIAYFAMRYAYNSSEEEIKLGTSMSDGSALISKDITEGTETLSYWSTDDEEAFQEDNEDFTIDEVIVQTFAVNDNGEVFGIATVNSGVNQEDKRSESYVQIEDPVYAWYIVSVDLDNTKLSYVSTISTSKNSQAQAIGFLPEEVVLGLLEE